MTLTPPVPFRNYSPTAVGIRTGGFGSYEVPGFGIGVFFSGLVVAGIFVGISSEFLPLGVTLAAIGILALAVTGFALLRFWLIFDGAERRIIRSWEVLRPMRRVGCAFSDFERVVISTSDLYWHSRRRTTYGGKCHNVVLGNKRGRDIDMHIVTAMDLTQAREVAAFLAQYMGLSVEDRSETQIAA